MQGAIHPTTLEAELPDEAELADEPRTERTTVLDARAGRTEVPIGI